MNFWEIHSLTNKESEESFLLAQLKLVSVSECPGLMLTLQNIDDITVNNDRVLLESKTFRLNYTARFSEDHKFLVVIENNFGSTR